ncbi:FtsX-like permease family protein [Culicoidibacter larvae]|uniref:FtsX-like permease family protein n=1 Tax=Culicoidibacter larvae TaxID=2579976 RepID=A0A5R8QD27_9FIRM|nr:FtsX-like permease family protein [Culicoidibacter larvae]TLG74166.1 FtsX-like permease family protein [Culicoidibacter larvae]
MRKSALNKDIVREIMRSKTRFLSILALIALGVFVFIGLKVTGPSMRNVADAYYQQYQLADMSVISTYGLDEDDQKAIDAVPGLKTAEYGYFTDALIDTDGHSARIFSQTDELSQYQVTDGRMPAKSGEIALDSNFAGKNNYQLGETITLYDNEQEPIKETLTRNQFTIVGFVRSPEFVETTRLGQTSVGSGTLNTFGVVPEVDFDLPVYTIARLAFTDTANIPAYSDQYTDLIAQHTTDVEVALKPRPELRLQSIKREAQTEIADAEKKIRDGRQQITDTDALINDGAAELDAAKAQLSSSQTILDEKAAAGLAELQAGSKKLSDAKIVLDESLAAITAGEVQLNQATEQYNAAASLLAAAQAQADQTRADLTARQSQLDADALTLAATETDLQNRTTSLSNDLASQTVAWNTWQTDQDALNDRRQQEGDTPEIQALQALLDARKIDLQNRDQELATEQSQLQADQSQYDQDLVAWQNQEATLNGEWQVLNATQAQLDIQAQQLQQVKATLDAKSAELKAAKQLYNQGLAAYQSGYQVYEANSQLYYEQINSAQAQINSGLATLASSEAAFNEKATTWADARPEAASKLADAEIKLLDAKKDLATLKLPVYTARTRDDNTGYTQYYENSTRIDVLSNVFPVFFFAIAALVSLTTMTRMVDEQRSQMGTLKALGYERRSIMKKFVIYGTVAAIVGALIGIILGHTILPNIIFTAYSTNYNFGSFSITISWLYSFIGIAIAILCTTGAAIFSARSDLKDNATELMRPKPPKSGNRIFLERMTFIWKRMSFNYKVTARNLFRYKKRMFMTIFGVAGCTALLITGFGIKDSLTGIVDKQYGEIYHYDLTAVYKDDATDSAIAEETRAIAQNSDVTASKPITYQNYNIKVDNTTQTITLVTPQESSDLPEFITLRDRNSHEEYTLSDTGAIISEKIATELSIGPGDAVEIIDNDSGEKFQVQISEIAEMYIGHSIYLSPAYYETVFGETPKVNASFIELTADGKSHEAEFSSELMQDKTILTVIQSNYLSTAMDAVLGSLNTVIVVLIVCASLLALVVLYNLTNINVSERIRELSTIKVLGFYPKEVTMYVYRETLFLTGFGILIGYGLGWLMHYFIITMLPPEAIMFSPPILMTNYIISALITFFFSLVVMVLIHRKLRKVDMIEALKSVE